MRKYQQRQILEIISTLGEAAQEITRLHFLNDTSTATRLLADSQTGVEQIVDFIEQLEGEGTQTVSLLVEYFELLYRISVEVNNGGNGTGLGKKLMEQLTQIENCAKDELKSDKTEMIFIPYNASMWDSLESIWLAAQDDPQCEVYVIPVPYYERLPNGAPGQLIYEGDQYPDYVPIVDWRSYNIEQRHPDVIFTHNPYDGNNFVTTIHPNYYNERLRNFTDLLVYVPYFVVMDNVPEHFCICPGTLYADKVFVQSEVVRNTYIREFHKMEKQNNCKGKFGIAKKKFVALGSPKFDRELGTKKEDFRIPDQWQRLIDQPGGGKKKVILYNTTIADLLAGNEKVLDKLRYVFDHFKNRNDAVLWWRPHPLNKATYLSLRPQLYKEYLDIVTLYKLEGYGIYDDTADLHRAIAVSNGYYGDWGSVVALYGMTGKPLIKQNINYIYSANGIWNKLAFENLYDDGRYFWCTAFNFNGLFRIDKLNWEAEYIGSFPREKANGWRQYASLSKNGDKLYFAPRSANEIAVFDMVEKTFSKIQFNEPKTTGKIKYLPNFKFCDSVSYKNWVFFIGFSYPAFLRYDTITGQLDYFSDWVSPINNMAAESKDVYFRKGITVNGTIVLASSNANAVVMFDMETCVSSVFEVGRKNYRYSGVCFDGNSYWLAPREKGPIVRWNPDEMTLAEYMDYPEGFVGDMLGFNSISYCNGCVWVFPNRANMALKITIQDESISVAKEFQQECETDTMQLTNNYIISTVIGDVIYSHAGKINQFIEYNCKTGAKRIAHIALPSEATEVCQEAMRLYLDKDATACRNDYDCYFYESPVTPLDACLHYILQSSESSAMKALHDRQIKIHTSKNANANGTAGSMIYSYCKREVGI